METAHKVIYDVIIIGGGQSALAVAYYLRRTGLNYVILDREQQSGGAWQHGWKSLSLFSPALWSSLPGVIMPGGQQQYPDKSAIITYIKNYEARYQFPIIRPVMVTSVEKQDNIFVLTTTNGKYYASTVVSATGSYANPYVPAISGMDEFEGSILHAAQYEAPEIFTGKRVAIVGEGNSGAQILAEISKFASTLWITQQPPAFLPDHIDGRYLFDAATQQYEAKQQGKNYEQPSLGHIVMVPAVKEARDSGVYQQYLPAFRSFYKDGIAWQDGHREKVDAVIFCTGFRPVLAHLQPLGIIQPDGKISTRETQATAIHGLWLVGYGSWTGFASATLIGVGRTAKKTVEAITAFLAP